MAEHRPLILGANGLPMQLPDGDTLVEPEGAGGGGRWTAIETVSAPAGIPVAVRTMAMTEGKSYYLRFENYELIYGSSPQGKVRFSNSSGYAQDWLQIDDQGGIGGAIYVPRFSYDVCQYFGFVNSNYYLGQPAVDPIAITHGGSFNFDRFQFQGTSGKVWKLEYVLYER